MLSRILTNWWRGRGAPVAVARDAQPAPVMRAPVMPVSSIAPTAPLCAQLPPSLSPPLPPALPMPDNSPLAVLRRMRTITPEVRKYLHPAGVADDLLRYCQQEGHTGWLTVTEVAAAWKERHEQIGISTCRLDTVLNELAARPDVRKRRVRLAMSPEYAEVRRRLQAMGKRDERAILYFLPPSPEDAAAMAAARAAEIAAGNAPPAPPTSKPGRRPAAATVNPVSGRSDRSEAGPRPGSPRPASPAPVIADLFAVAA